MAPTRPRDVAVRDLEARDAPATQPTVHRTGPCPDPRRSHLMTAREILERQFPTELIRRRSGRNGDEVVYLEASTVVARLNEAFAGEWSFVVEKHEVLADEVIVLGRLSAGAVGKSAFGSSAVTRAREG